MVSIFQVGRCDEFIQACASEVWITCATWDITLVVGHILGTHLSDTADALSKWHLGNCYTDKVDSLVNCNGPTLHPIPEIFSAFMTQCNFRV